MVIIAKFVLFAIMSRLGGLVIGYRLFFLILALSSFAYAVSMTTSYQGYLEDAVGEPLSSTVDMSFA